MIKIGMTTFSEHGSLMNKDKLTLEEYASFFPIIELDTSFYGIQSPSVSESWTKKTPDSFQFILKAFQGMTKHNRFDFYYSTEQEMFETYKSFLKPIKSSEKLASILFQFPSSFNCAKENVNYLKQIRDYLPNEPISIEFRNQSWYEKSLKQQMLTFMKNYHYSLVMVDEPQVPIHSVPFDTNVTEKSFAFVRLHGRNKAHWLNHSPDWRKKRNLYCYSEEELRSLAMQLNAIEANEIAVIFNNNSERDAAPNGITLKKILDIDYDGLNPNQISLF